MTDTYTISGYLLTSQPLQITARDNLKNYLDHDGMIIKDDIFSTGRLIRDFAAVSFVTSFKTTAEGLSNILSEFEELHKKTNFLKCKIYIEAEDNKVIKVIDYLLEPKDIERLAENIKRENWNVYIQEVLA